MSRWTGRVSELASRSPAASAAPLPPPGWPAAAGGRPAAGSDAGAGGSAAAGESGESAAAGKPGKSDTPAEPGEWAARGPASPPDRPDPTATSPGGTDLSAGTGSPAKSVVQPRPVASAADTWLRCCIAAVGCLLLVALVGGSAAPSGAPVGGRRPGASGPAIRVSPSASPSAPVAVPSPVLAGNPGSGPRPVPARVAAALAGPLTDPRLGGQVSAQVVDVATGTVLLDRRADQPAVPASTAKLATAAALLAVRRPDDRLATTVLAGAAPGQLVLVGGGDPTLSTAPAGQPEVYPGAARISDLAAAVRRSGTTRVTGIVVDGSEFTGPTLAPGWNPADVPGGYVAPVTAVAVDGGRLDPAQLARSTDPDLAAGRALATALGAPAVPVLRGRAPADARRLAQVRSAPMSALVEQMLLVSDNLLAEALARQVALAEHTPASFAGAAEAVRRVLARLGVSVAGEELVDGSGLSTRNRIAPSVLAAVVRAALSGRHPALHALVPGLPVAGYDGTLEGRYLAGPAALAAGQVRAKTGTLDGVSTLAGVVSAADGRLYAFVFMADQVPIGGTRPAESALDDAASALAACGCR